MYLRKGTDTVPRYHSASLRILPLLILALQTEACVTIPEGVQSQVLKADATVILISIDGFRADYWELHKPPHLTQLAEQGTRAAYLQPVFPTKTFPNHYTLVTGLYPAHHGIVNNSMYDPEFKASFSLSNRDAVSNGRWWEGEPLWVTVQKQGRTSAVYFWPGSEAEIQGHRPTFWMPYDHAMPHAARIDSVMAAIKRSPRPALVTLYFSVVDTQGHRHGPESDEVASAIIEVDHQIGQLIEQLKEAKLLDAVNIVVVSDHGMASSSLHRVEMIDDYVNLDEVFVVDLDPVSLLNVKSAGNLERIHHGLKRMQHVAWYQPPDIPGTLKFSGHRRIPDLIGIADEGWRIGTSRQMQNVPNSFKGGTHGYDPRVKSMQALFIAHGPAFKLSLIHI